MTRRPARPLALALALLAAAPLGRAQTADVPPGVWERADDAPAESPYEGTEMRTVYRQIASSDTGLVVWAIVEAVSGDDRGLLQAWRWTGAPLPSGAVDAHATVRTDGDTLWVERASGPATPYTRASGQLPVAALGDWDVPPALRSPPRLTLTADGSMLARGDTLFTGVAVVGPYVVTDDQDVADLAEFESGRRAFESFEVYRYDLAGPDALVITIAPDTVRLRRAEVPTEMGRARPLPEGPLPEGFSGTWVHTDTVDVFFAGGRAELATPADPVAWPAADASDRILTRQTD